MLREFVELPIIPERLCANTIVLGGVLAFGRYKHSVWGVGKGSHVAAVLFAELSVLQTDFILPDLVEVHTVVLGGCDHLLAFVVELYAVD